MIVIAKSLEKSSSLTDLVHCWCVFSLYLIFYLFVVMKLLYLWKVIDMVFLNNFVRWDTLWLLRGIVTLFLDQPHPLFQDPLPFLEIQNVPVFHRSIKKAKVLNNSYNQFVYNFYPQSILILEECLQKWWDANLI